MDFEIFGTKFKNQQGILVKFFGLKKTIWNKLKIQKNNFLEILFINLNKNK